ncbi:MAG: helix-turn-helix transcriptional regulator [Phycisphaeraceae bacterium]|nr:helix-turn-helix transcriptional regulator [Phycisphaeraceae bacterium]
MNSFRNQPTPRARAARAETAGPLRPSIFERGDAVRRRVYAGSVGAIGAFRCPPTSSLWNEENRTGDMPTFAFARDPVTIAQADFEPVVATSNEAMLYNAHQPYRRRRLADEGDRCEFIVIRPDILREIVAAHDPAAAQHDRPIRWPSAPAAPGVFMAQRALYRYVAAHATDLADPPAVEAQRDDRPRQPAPDVDHLLVDEALINIVDILIHAAAERAAPTHARPATARDHRAWIEGAKAYLARNLDKPLTLDDVAAAVGVSMFHLCRLFKQHTGDTIHAYVRSLRVRASLDRLAEPGLSIGDFAERLGFCNQSHYTRAFRAEFGLTPTHARRALLNGAAPRELLDAAR